MANEIDALSLSITANTTQAKENINKLIDSLKNLDTRFRSLSGSTTYANNLETAVHSITRINNAISNIDDSKLKSVASALKSLGTAGNNLANFGNVSQAGKAMDTVSAKAQNMAKRLAESFHIKDKDAIDSLTSSIKTMITTMGKGDAFYAAEANVQKVIEDFGLFENKLHDVESTYEKVRQVIRSQPLYVPENYSSDANWLSNLATIGIKNTTHDMSAGVSAGQLASQLESLVPALQGVANESDIINVLADYLRNNATPAMIGFNEAFMQGDEAWFLMDDAIRQTEQSLGIIVPSLQELEQHMRQFGGDDATIQSWRDSMQSVSTVVQQMNDEMAKMQQSSEPFDRIVQGLEQLDGVTIGDFSNISVLAEGVNKLGYQSAVTASQTLPLIADGLRQFEGFDLPDLGDMDSFSRGLRSLGSKAVQNAANALPFVADGLKQLKNVGDLPHMDGLNEFAKALSIFGRQTSTTAVQTIPQLTQAFQKLFETMSKAPKISQNTIDAANAMANLANKTGGVTRALNGANPSLNLWSKNAGRATKSTFSLASAIGKVYATYWMLFRAFGMIGKAINIASDLTEVKNVVVQAFGDMAYKATEFADTAGEAFGMSKLQALDAASRYQAMGKTMGITDRAVAKSNDFLREKLSDTLALEKVQQGYGDLGDTAADMSINLTKLAGDLASLYNTDIDVAAEKLNSIFTGTTKPLREFGFDLTQATLQEWALRNGIDANVKSMTQAQKAVLRYQYVMANASFVMGDFARTSESWHNSIVRLKLAFQNLGSVVGQGFINLLKPAVQKITAFVNTLTGLVQKALNAIGKLLGWQLQIDPVKPLGDGVGGSGDSGMDDMEEAANGAGKGAEETADAMDDADQAAEGTADNLDKAQKAAKKMKDYLLGIDELNVFQPDTDKDTTDKDKKKKDKADKDKKGKGGSGSGNKGGAGSEGGATGGNVTFEKYESDISSWFGLGKKIGDALSKAMEGIDWDSIYKKAEKFGTGLASFLNGLISPRLFENLGKTIAGALNTALHFLDSFGKHFDWKNFGASIAAGINGFFKNFDFKLLASVLNTWAIGLLDTLIVALKKTDWEMIGTKIGEFLVNIKWLTIGKKVAQAIWEAINAAFKLYKGMFKTAPLETAILTLVGAFKLFNTLQTATWFKNLAKTIGVFNTELAAGNGILAAVNIAFPTLGKVISRVSQVFSIGVTAVSDFSRAMSYGLTTSTSMQIGFSSLVSGVNAFAASLSPLATVIGSAIGGIVEFFTVSDAIKGLITGTQSLKSSIAELAIGIGVAATAFTLVLGFPAGLIATGIVGLIAAIKGVNDAFKQIQIETFGNQVKNALINPGGTPIEEIVGATRDSLQVLGDSFGELATKAEKLDSVDQDISDIGNEIETLNLKLQMGTITQEEYTQRIADCYSRLSQAIQTKLNDAEIYVVAALGEGSPVSNALKNQEVDVDTLAKQTIQSAGEIKVRMQELINELSTLDPSNPNYSKYQQELLQLASGEDNVSQATLALQTATSKNIDWASFIDEDGALKVESISGILGEVAGKADDVKTNAETSLNGVVTAMKNAGNEVGAEEVKNAIPGALDDINSGVSEQCTKMSDTIQQDAIDNITDIINQAAVDWENSDAWTKAVYQYNQDSYIMDAVKSYKTNVIDPLSQTIDTEYQNLGIVGAGWASEAADKILEGAFDTENIPQHGQNYTTTLNENWQQAISDAATTTYDTAKEKGKDVADGIGEGMKESDTDAPVQGFFTKLWNSFASIFKSHSPAKAMYPMGANIMGGIVEGFKEKYSEITSAISTWFTKYVQPWFTVEKWSQLGLNIKNAIISKWNEFKTQWITSISNWWTSNVVPWLDLEKWKAEADHIRDAVITKFKDMVTQWITAISNWWTQNVQPKFDLELWKGEADHIRDAIITKFNEMVESWNTKISTWWNSIVEFFKVDKWKEQTIHIKDAIIGAIDETIKEWGSKIGELVQDFGEKFKTSDFKKIGEDAMTALWEGMKSIGDQIKQWWQGIKDFFTNNPIKIKAENETSDAAAQASTSTQTSDSGKKPKSNKAKKKASGGVFDDGRWRNVHAYASGGIPDEGQLFWAREQGAELVGQIGGNTAVMNNDQIVASVASGVQQAVTEALAPYLSDISQNTRVTANKDFTVQIGDRQIAEANTRGQRQLGAVLFT